jgi:hypothetical protein
VRSLIIAGAVLIASVATSQAQPWYGPGYGPPPPAYGYGYRPPPPRFYGPGPAYYDPPPRRCWVRPGPWGPERVCRRGW